MLKKIVGFEGKLLSKKEQLEIKGGLFTYNVDGFTVRCINQLTHVPTAETICGRNDCLLPFELCGTNIFF